jgi:restriction endonuclease S subunit
LPRKKQENKFGFVGMEMRKKFDEIFEDCTKLGTKIKTDEYHSNGKHPIIDQGQEMVAGFTDLEDGLLDAVPAIVFGDHTRIIKYVDCPFFLGADGVKVLRSKVPNANYRYLYYALKNAKIPNTGYNRHYKWLKELEIEYPPIDQQVKTVKVLDKVESIIYNRQNQLQKLDELVKARFVEMFGDPVTNPMDWPTKPLLEMGYCKNGMNFHTGDSGIEMHCLGVGDFKDYSVIDGTDYLPTISLNEAPPEESMLQDGDLVFVRSNGNKALVGRCLLVYPHNTPTTYSGFCIRYRLTSAEVNIAYLLRVLKTDSMRKKMAGRGANIQNLNQQILAALNIPTPPLELQEWFTAFIEQIDKSKVAVQKSLDEAQLLFDSLMQHYFG